MRSDVLAEDLEWEDKHQCINKHKPSFYFHYNLNVFIGAFFCASAPPSLFARPGCDAEASQSPWSPGCDAPLFNRSVIPEKSSGTTALWEKHQESQSHRIMLLGTWRIRSPAEHCQKVDATSCFATTLDETPTGATCSY